MSCLRESPLLQKYYFLVKCWVKFVYKDDRNTATIYNCPIKDPSLAKIWRIIFSLLSNSKTTTGSKVLLSKYFYRTLRGHLGPTWWRQLVISARDLRYLHRHVIVGITMVTRIISSWRQLSSLPHEYQTLLPGRINVFLLVGSVAWHCKGEKKVDLWHLFREFYFLQQKHRVKRSILILFEWHVEEHLPCPEPFVLF